MSKLPCEILDHIVDLLHDSRTPLRNYCLVSKSWITRTRTHLFARVEFQTADSLESWKKIFPDPSTSPAHYTKVLLIGGSAVVTAVDVEAGSWIRGFSRVVHLAVVGEYPATPGCTEAAFNQIRGFLPSVKSFCINYVVFSPSQLWDLILSFPLLEDLSVIGSYPVFASGDDHHDGLSTATQPSSLPVFTGSLELLLSGRMRPTLHHWLSLPGGVHFRRLALKWTCKEDISLTVVLIEECTHTLESLDITDDYARADLTSAPFDLSKTTKLGDAVFRPGSLGVGWISSVLRGITCAHRDLRRVLVDLPYGNEDLTRTLEGGFEQWLDLDRTLVHLRESFSIRTYVRWARGRWYRDYLQCLLPEMAGRGMIALE